MRFPLVVLSLALIPLRLVAQPFQLPTANRALFEPGGEERFFVGTTGKPWTSGTFGCVRSDGRQMHEGLDIRSIQRDKKGEPIDPVLAAADGTVAYVNTKPGLSNYGNYVILRHKIEGIEICSLYAHLRSVRDGLKAGADVKAGEPVGVLGRTSNTRERISPERAHVHFELDLVVNERFAQWHDKFLPGQRNDHGNWNGQNLIGIDPRLLLLQQRRDGSKFSLVSFLRTRTELCRVLVAKADFPWVRRHPALIRRNPLAEKEGVAAWELALDFNGVPFQLTPRAASELKSKSRFQLLSVNETEQAQNPARRLVAKKGDRWELTPNAENLLGLLTF